MAARMMLRWLILQRPTRLDAALIALLTVGQKILIVKCGQHQRFPHVITEVTTPLQIQSALMREVDFAQQKNSITNAPKVLVVVTILI